MNTTFFPNTEQGKFLFEKLQKMYAEPQRFYHNLTHIENLFILFSQYQTQIEDPKAIFWTIWFHDCIYQPQKNDNEEQSAIIAEKELKTLKLETQDLEIQDSINNTQTTDKPINTEFITKVSNFILATKTHTNPTQNNDLQWFLDFDLAVLGSSESIYDEYAANIRKEYAHIPTWKYNFGRKKVLTSFLAKPKIFHCLAPHYEQQARENLAREIQQLAKYSFIHKFL